MAVLHAEPKKLMSFGTLISSGDQILTELDISAFRGKGRFELDGESFTIEPEGFFRTNAVLHKGSSVIARATQPSFFRRRFEISSAGHRLVLESEGFMGREYVLLLGSQEIGRIQREGFTGRKLHLEFPDDMPSFLQVFVAFLVLSQVRREAAAASGS